MVVAKKPKKKQNKKKTKKLMTCNLKQKTVLYPILQSSMKIIKNFMLYSKARKILRTFYE